MMFDIEKAFENWRKSKGYRSQTAKNTVLASYESKKEGYTAGYKQSRIDFANELNKIYKGSKFKDLRVKGDMRIVDLIMTINKSTELEKAEE